MSAYIEEVLRKMGWVDGFQIPVANEENRLLEEKVAELLLKKAQATVALQSATAKYDALEKHLKMVNQENEQHQVHNAVYQNKQLFFPELLLKHISFYSIYLQHYCQQQRFITTPFLMDFGR